MRNITQNSDALLLSHPRGGVQKNVSPALTEHKLYTKTVPCSNLNSPATLMNLSFFQGSSLTSTAVNAASRLNGK